MFLTMTSHPPFRIECRVRSLFETTYRNTSISLNEERSLDNCRRGRREEREDFWLNKIWISISRRDKGGGEDIWKGIDGLETRIETHIGRITPPIVPRHGYKDPWPASCSTTLCTIYRTTSLERNCPCSDSIKRRCNRSIQFVPLHLALQDSAGIGASTPH